MKNYGAGFSLLEVVLALGIFAFAAALFVGWIGAQTLVESKNRGFAEGMEIMDDFCAFVEISSFDDVKTLADSHATLYATAEEDGGIIYRKFVPKADLDTMDSGKRLGYAVEIEPMEPLFSGENPESRYYIPLSCKLLRVSKDFSAMAEGNVGEDFSTFITVKNY
jgi:hypothetical protein